MMIQETRERGVWPVLAEGQPTFGFSSGPDNPHKETPINFSLRADNDRTIYVRMTVQEFERFVAKGRESLNAETVTPEDKLILNQFESLFPAGLALDRVRIGPTVRYAQCRVEARLAFRRQIEKLVRIGMIRRIIAKDEQFPGDTPWIERLFQITEGGRAALKGGK